MSKKAQHTPGPWTIEYDGSLCMAGQIVAPEIAPEGAGQQEKLANSNLIAAAPELLEALEAMRRFAADLEDNGFSPSDKGRADRLHAQARAAVAKAKGE